MGDGEEKYKVWGAGSVRARAGELGGFLCLTATSLSMKGLEICGCSMFIPPAMWGAGQLCQGSVGLFPRPSRAVSALGAVQDIPGVEETSELWK